MFRELNENYPSWKRDLLAQLMLGFAGVMLLMNYGIGGRSDAGGNGKIGKGGAPKHVPDLFGTIESAATPAKHPTDSARIAKDKPPEEKKDQPAKPPQPEKKEPVKPKNANEWVDHADKSLAAAPAATAVEEKPKAAKEMTAKEMAETLGSYQQWMHKGQIKLRLDLSDVNAKQMEPAVGFYILNSSSSGLRFQVGPGQEVKPLKDLPPGKLIGDLPDSLWPAALAHAATDRLGQNYRAHANIILSDNCQLRIYRLLAQAVEDKTFNAADEFVMRLRPSRKAGDIDLSLVRRTPLKLAAP